MNTTPDSTCRRGHPLSVDNVYWDNNGHGHPQRRCRACRRNANDAYRARRAGCSEITHDAPAAPLDGWQLRARCRGADPDDFLPGEHERGIPNRARHAAARFCVTCPVAEHCGQSATAHRDHGLWGGAWRDHDNHNRAYRVRSLI